MKGRTRPFSETLRTILRGLKIELPNSKKEKMPWILSHPLQSEVNPTQSYLTAEASSSTVATLTLATTLTSKGQWLSTKSTLLSRPTTTLQANCCFTRKGRSSCREKETSGEEHMGSVPSTSTSWWEIGKDDLAFSEVHILQKQRQASSSIRQSFSTFAR